MRLHIRAATPSTSPKEPRLDDPIIDVLDDSDSQDRIAHLRLTFSGVTSVKAFHEANGTAVDLADCLRHDLLRPDYEHPDAVKFIDSVSL